MRFFLPSYSDLNQMLDSEKPDIVSICSPVEYHYQQVAMCVERNIPMVWLEKPTARNIQEVDLLLEKVGRGNTKVLVNYQRRFMGVYQQLRNIFRQDDFGKCQAIQLNYSQGLEQNGSHVLDVLFYVVGDSCQWSLNWVSLGDDTGNPSFAMKMQEGIEVIAVGAATPYHCIDISFIFEQGRVSVLHGGMTLRIENKEEHEFFPGFFRLKDNETLSGGADMLSAMPKALDGLIDSHKFSREPESSIATAKNSMQVMQEVRKWQPE